MSRDAFTRRQCDSGAIHRGKQALRLLLYEKRRNAAEEAMMNTIHRAFALAFVAAMLADMALAGISFARAEGTATDAGASMVQPPQAPASGVNAHNPDNMPVKRPTKPTNDPIARGP